MGGIEQSLDPISILSLIVSLDSNSPPHSTTSALLKATHTISSHLNNHSSVCGVLTYHKPSIPSP